jgi:hypothetical protein
MAHSSIRFGIGRFTTEEEIDFVTNKIVAIVERASPSCPRPFSGSLLALLTSPLMPLHRSARSVAVVGDVPGGDRHQVH